MREEDRAKNQEENKNPKMRNLKVQGIYETNKRLSDD
jgi:ABC-type lipoprotein release transport system permease subunit